MRILAIIASLIFVALPAIPQTYLPFVRVVDGGASPITADFTAKCIQDSTTCLAPAAIFLNARTTTHSGSVTKLFKTLTYYWDCGDPGNGNWPYGSYALDSGWDRNYGYGPLTGCVYEDAGTYTITLTVRDEDGNEDEYTENVTIVDPAAHFTTAQTWCFADVSTTGDFSACTTLDTTPGGSCEVEPTHCVDTTDFDAALVTCGATGTAPRWCRFRRGDEFAWDTARSLGNSTGPALLDAFGTGAKPLFEQGANDVDGGSIGSHWTIAYVEFHRDDDACAVKGTCGMYLPANSNAMLFDVKATGFSRAWGSDDDDVLNALVLYDYVQDRFIADSGTPTPRPGQMMLLAGSENLILGSNLDMNYNGEYITRWGTGNTGTGDNSAMIHTTLQHTNSNEGDYGRRPIEIRGKHDGMYFMGLHMLNCAAGTFAEICERVGGCGSGAESDTVNVIFERNFHSIESGCGGAGDALTRGYVIQASDITVRENIFDLRGHPDWGNLWKVCSIESPTFGLLENLDCNNNTVYVDDSNTADFLGIDGCSLCDGNCRAGGNLFYTPDANTVGGVDGAGCSADATVEAATNPFVATGLPSSPAVNTSTPADFAIVTGSDAIDAGHDCSANDDEACVEDFFGNCRTSGSEDAGAHEFGASPCAP